MTSATVGARMPRADEVAVAVFGTWMVTGLFVDGWAHNAEKPENFFTPWHLLLYSGFGAAMLYGVVNRRTTGPERLMKVGVVMFGAGAFGDFVWHSIFGVEEDISALLSPTHLLLMTGGILMASGPARSAWHDGSETASDLRRFLPTVISITLSLAIVHFFLQYGSAFRIEHEAMATAADDAELIYGLLSVQLTNLLLVGPMLFVLARWTPPPGTFTVLFGGTAFAMTGLLGFEHLPLAAAAVLGGAAADALVARGSSARITATAVPAVMWSAWFAVYAARWDLGWTIELVTGSILFTAMGGYALSFLSAAPTSRRAGDELPPRTPAPRGRRNGS